MSPRSKVTASYLILKGEADWLTHGKYTRNARYWVQVLPKSNCFIQLSSGRRLLTSTLSSIRLRISEEPGRAVWRVEEKQRKPLPLNKIYLHRHIFALPGKNVAGENKNTSQGLRGLLSSFWTQDYFRNLYHIRCSLLPSCNCGMATILIASEVAKNRVCSCLLFFALKKKKKNIQNPYSQGP